MLYVATLPSTIDCARCTRTEYHVHTSDMTDQAHYALWYAMALIGGPGSRAERAFKTGVGRAAQQMSEADLRDALKAGLKELLEKGLMDAERGGEGELVPKVLHLERLAEPSAFATA